MVKDISAILGPMRKAVNRPAVVQNKDAFNVLVATVLSQRTRARMQGRQQSSCLPNTKNTASAISKPQLKDIEKSIKPAGFYKVKAKGLQEISRLIVEKFNGTSLCSRAAYSPAAVGRKNSKLCFCLRFWEAGNSSGRSHPAHFEQNWIGGI